MRHTDHSVPGTGTTGPETTGTGAPAASPAGAPTGRLTPALAVATIVLYAAGYPLGSGAVGAMSSSLVVLLRFVASAAILWAIVLARRTRLPGSRQLVHIAVAGLLSQGVQFLALYWALAHEVSAGLASLVIALNPVVTAGILVIVTRRRESRLGALALGLGAAAVVVACLPKILADHSVGASLLAVVVAMLGLCCGGLYQGAFVKGADAWVITAVGITASIPLAGVASLWDHDVADPGKAAILIGIMVVVSSVGATTLYAACIRRAGARASSILFAVIPAAASLMSWIALGEGLTLFAVVGMCLGAAACLVQSRAAR